MVKFGYKTKFKRSPDSGTTYVQVAALIDFEEGGISRGSVTTTNMDDTTGFNKHEPAPLRDVDDYSITLEWDDADQGQIDLLADLDLDVNGFYQIEYPDGTTVSFEGHITSWGKDVSMEDRIKRTVKFKVSGKPVVA